MKQSCWAGQGVSAVISMSSVAKFPEKGAEVRALALQAAVSGSYVT